jgi:hypothetical protein
MGPVETIPGMEVRKIKEKDAVNSTMMHCKNLYNCHNVSPVHQLKKKERSVSWGWC